MPVGQPANLQGIWNNLMNPPWGSKYTININTEMNYWPAEVTNLTEMHEPLVQMVKELSVTGQETARVMYGAKGCGGTPQHRFVAHYRPRRSDILCHVAHGRRLAEYASVGKICLFGR